MQWVFNLSEQGEFFKDIDAKWGQVPYDVGVEDMKIVQLTPGAGAMYCGNCLRDNALVASFCRKGHSGLMLPLYLPLTLDELDLSGDKPIFFSGISVYLEQKFPWMGRMPKWLHQLLKSRKLLKMAAGKAAATRPEDVGELTLSMLRGEEGNQKRELDELVAYLRDQEKPDVICLSNAMLIGMARMLHQELNVPVICMLQGEDDFLDALPESERQTAWQLLSEREADISQFVAPTRYFAEKMGSRLGLDPQRISIIPNGIDPAGFAKSAQSAPRESDQPKILGYFARMCREKGLHIAVEAYRQVMKTGRFPDLQFHIGGSCGPTDQLLVDDLSRDLKNDGLLENVRFFPNVTKAEKQAFFHELDLFSVPAEYSEAFGLYLLEAMAAGVPVVQPAVSGFEEIVGESQSGWCYGANTPENLAGAIIAALDQPGEAAARGAQGANAITTTYHIDRVADQYLELFQRIIPGK